MGCRREAPPPAAAKRCASAAGAECSDDAVVDAHDALSEADAEAGAAAADGDDAPPASGAGAPTTQPSSAAGGQQHAAVSSCSQSCLDEVAASNLGGVHARREGPCSWDETHDATAPRGAPADQATRPATADEAAARARQEVRAAQPGTPAPAPRSPRRPTASHHACIRTPREAEGSMRRRVSDEITTPGISGHAADCNSAPLTLLIHRDEDVVCEHVPRKEAGV